MKMDNFKKFYDLYMVCFSKGQKKLHLFADNV